MYEVIAPITPLNLQGVLLSPCPAVYHAKIVDLIESATWMLQFDAGNGLALTNHKKAIAIIMTQAASTSAIFFACCPSSAVPHHLTLPFCLEHMYLIGLCM